MAASKAHDCSVVRWVAECILCGVMAERPALRSEGQGLKEDGAGRKISSYIV